MAETSKIQWTDATWNVITGCTLVDDGCRHCYAATLAATRLKNHPSRKGLARLNAAGEAKFTGEVRFNDDWLTQPLRWRRPRRIFVCAHGDLFHEAVPDGWIDRVFAVMALAPRHVFQVLTKRPARARDYLTGAGLIRGANGRAARIIAIAVAMQRADLLPDGWPLRNVWLGTSVSDQASADARIPDLLACPAAVRFVSAEPLLGPVDLRNLRRYNPRGESWIDAMRGLVTRGQYLARSPSECSFATSTQCIPPELPRLDLVIVGGESGTKARPMRLGWARAIKDQCASAGVACFVKQLGRSAIMDRGDAVQPCALGAGWEALEPGGPLGLVRFCDSHGGDMAEWPPDMRVRQMPGEIANA